MTFQTLKQQFHAGLVSKPDFISQALQQHRALFDYVAVTRSTDVREIHISGQGVRFRVAEPGQGGTTQDTVGVWLHCPPDEARVAPIEVMNFDHYEPDETRVMDLLAAGARQILDVGANLLVCCRQVRVADLDGSLERRVESPGLIRVETESRVFIELLQNVIIQEVEVQTTFEHVRRSRASQIVA